MVAWLLALAGNAVDTVLQVEVPVMETPRLTAPDDEKAAPLAAAQVQNH